MNIIRNILIVLLLAVNAQASNQDIFAIKVRITNNKGTVYELLKDLSKQSGYIFIYDSYIIDNDKIIKVAKGTHSLRDAIYLITGNDNLQMDLVGNYIVLRIPKTPIITDFSNTQDPLFAIRGALVDEQNGEPIISASIHILNTSLGAVTNMEGRFLLFIPDSLLQYKARFSHIGYESREIELSLLKDRHIDIEMKQQIIQLQEVIVNTVNPVQLLNDMLNNRRLNYSSEPAYLTTFYREGIDHNDRNIDLTESVIKVYKTGFHNKADDDQAKLIKKRRIVSRLQTDMIFPKILSGVQSCLILDVMKELPDFITPNSDSPYQYSFQGKSTIDDRPVFIIYFQQKEFFQEPLYRGELFIEADNKALVEVRFEVNPQLANKATNSFIDKKPFRLTMSLQQAKYKVSYKPSSNGLYYTNHIRGDVNFKIRRRNRLFTSTLHFWFEMATCDIETKNVRPIPSGERISTTRIFSETKSTFDKNFWQNFNIILPEENLKNAILHNLHEVLIPNHDLQE